MKITLDANPSDAPCCLKITAEDGQDLLIQTDWDWPGIANTFGWDKGDVQCEIAHAAFNRFEFPMPRKAAAECSHQGQCDEDVAYWAGKLERPAYITPELLAAELKEYGSWDAEQLADDSANWHRLIWLAAGNIQDQDKEDGCQHDQTDGTITCPECGCTASEFIAAARQWLDDNDGAEAEDPGYFEERRQA